MTNLIGYILLVVVGMFLWQNFTHDIPTILVILLVLGVGWASMADPPDYFGTGKN